MTNDDIWNAVVAPPGTTEHALRRLEADKGGAR